MEYIPVLIMMGLGLFVGGAILVLTHLLGTKVHHFRKNMPFECGSPPFPRSAQTKVSVRFFRVALLFLVLDVEGVFFYPWAMTFRKAAAESWLPFFELLFFVGIFCVGYFYILGSASLDWE